MIWSIYVSNAAKNNFDIGMQQNIWGAKKDVFRRGDVGDFVIFVFGLSWAGDEKIPSGYPRIKLDDIGNFKGKTQRVVITRVKYPYFDDKIEVWPDDLYPYRFTFEIIREFETNQYFGLDYCNYNFVTSVRKSLLSKGAIAEVEINSIDELYNPSSSTSNESSSTSNESSSTSNESSSTSNESSSTGDEPSKLNLTTSLLIKGKNEISPSLGVNEVSEALASIIVNQPDDSGMMVGIFGRWGRGKTYLAEKTWESIKQDKPDFQRVVFSAWKYQDTKSSWAYLYKSLLDEYLNETEADSLIDKLKAGGRKFIKLFKLNKVKHSIFPVISVLVSFIWLFLVSGKFEIYAKILSFVGVVTVLQITYFYFRYSGTIANLFTNYFSKKDFSDYLGLQAEVEDSITNLLKVWIKETDRNKKIVLFVDDVDRCNIEQIINIIDGLRVILDNPEINQRLIIITAVDERMLQHSLNYKYVKFHKELNEGNIFKEYLEKIFIVGLKLNPLTESEIQDFLNNIIPTSIIKPVVSINDEVSDEVSDEPNDEEVNSEIEDESNDEEVNSEIEDDPDLDILPAEREYILKKASELNNATPRKIRIFYYKYLILKKLLNIKLEKDNLLVEWNNIQDEHIIIDVLILSSNFDTDTDTKPKTITQYFENIDSSFMTEEIKNTIKYVVLMVSVL
jgi:hypothetical protein